MIRLISTAAGGDMLQGGSGNYQRLQHDDTARPRQSSHASRAGLRLPRCINRSATAPALIVLLICLLGQCGNSEGRALADPPEPQHQLRYEVVMSEDDGLCRPLANFYNSQIGKLDDETTGYIEDRFGGALKPPGPSFLLAPVFPPDTLPVLRNASLYPPWWHEMFSNLDIYNDGSSRTVIIIDSGISWRFISFRSSLLIMKPGYVENKSNVPSIEKLESHVPSTESLGKNGSIPVEQLIDFGRGGSSLNPEREGGYILKKYPSVDALMAQLKAGHRMFPVPILGQGVAQRIITFRGRIFVSARPRGEEMGQFILIYTIDKNGTINDRCYLELGPIPGRKG